MNLQVMPRRQSTLLPEEPGDEVGPRFGRDQLCESLTHVRSSCQAT